MASKKVLVSILTKTERYIEACGKEGSLSNWLSPSERINNSPKTDFFY
jgi:hypothetical protein